jgi:nucleoside-diphosphate-sugar epimerase
MGFEVEAREVMSLIAEIMGADAEIVVTKTHTRTGEQGSAARWPISYPMAHPGIALIRHLVAAIFDPRMDGMFNIESPDAETPIADLAALIVRTAGKRLGIEAGRDTVGSPLRRRPDVSLATAATRYTPSLPLTKGLRRCYAWYRSNVFDSRAQRR